MKPKQTISLLLALILATLTTASCSTQTASDSKTTGTQSSGTGTATESVSTEELTEMEKRALTKDELPEKDYGDKEFRISTKEEFLYEIYTEKEDGDILNDALFARNRAIEERFHVKIVPVSISDSSGNGQVSAVSKTLLAGEDAYDLVSSYVFTTGPIALDGMYLNWLELPYTDLSKPWWISGVNECFRIGDTVYTVVGDMCVSTLKLTYAVFYDRTLGTNYDINFDDISQSVKDGTWTIDSFTSRIKDVYTDVNGDGQNDSGDIYGFCAESATNLDVYTFAFDIPMTKRNSDGLPELALNTSKTVTAVEKVNQLYWGGIGSYISTSDFGEPINMFKNGKALFTTTYLANAFSSFRDMTDEYTILPYPKFDETQEKYLTGTMDNYSVLGIPYTEKDPEMASIITEALNIESYKTLFPTYYQEALQEKFSRDASSIEMLDILMQGRNFDMVTLFSSTISGIPWLFRGLVAGKSTDFASEYQKIEKSANTGLNNILKAYEENGNA